MSHWRPAVAKIYRQRLVHNLKLLKGLSPHPFFCAMVKANAYGHGAHLVAQVLKDCPEVTALGVGLIEEAYWLRKSGFQGLPLIYYGVLPKEGVPVCQEYNIQPVISTAESLEVLSNHHGSQSLLVHIKIDTGMHRLGFSLEEHAYLETKLKTLPSFVKIIGIMSHLAKGWDFILSENDSYSLKQLKSLLRFTGRINSSWAKPILHLFNTQGLVACHLSSAQSFLKQFGSRLGIGLYGYVPDINHSLPLKPVMDLESQLVHVFKIKKNEGVSYGHSWIAGRDSILGVIPLGYADGLPKIASNKAKVIINGTQVPQVGNITMDSFLVDLTDLPEHYRQVGTRVTIFGDTPVTAQNWADWGSTIVWDILSGLSRRVARELVE